MQVQCEQQNCFNQHQTLLHISSGRALSLPIAPINPILPIKPINSIMPIESTYFVNYCAPATIAPAKAPTLFSISTPYAAEATPGYPPPHHLRKFIYPPT